MCCWRLLGFIVDPLHGTPRLQALRATLKQRMWSWKSCPNSFDFKLVVYNDGIRYHTHLEQNRQIPVWFGDPQNGPFGVIGTVFIWLAKLSGIGLLHESSGIQKPMGKWWFSKRLYPLLDVWVYASPLEKSEDAPYGSLFFQDDACNELHFNQLVY